MRRLGSAALSVGKKKSSSSGGVVAVAGTTPTANAPAEEVPQPSASAAGSLGGGAADTERELREARDEAAAAKAQVAQLVAQLAAMTSDNNALKGQVHLLKFKCDLLIDMVTLANLDCDKLEDELEEAMRVAALKAEAAAKEQEGQVDYA